MADGAVSEQAVLQILALRIDPVWRRLGAEERAVDRDAFARAIRQTGAVTTLVYSTVGLRADADLVLVRTAAALDDLEENAARLLRSGMGRFASASHAFTGLIRSSRYVKKPGAQEQALISGERARYLIVYPFTKTTEWYLLGREARQGMMNEHIRIGHDFPQVRQLLAYSTGLDDQEFIVAYETDDLPAFQDLVTALRETDARPYTMRDQPILTAIFRPLDEALDLLG